MWWWTARARIYLTRSIIRFVCSSGSQPVRQSAYEFEKKDDNLRNMCYLYRWMEDTAITYSILPSIIVYWIWRLSISNMNWLTFFQGIILYIRPSSGHEGSVHAYSNFNLFAFEVDEGCKGSAKISPNILHVNFSFKFHHISFAIRKFIQEKIHEILFFSSRNR